MIGQLLADHVDPDAVAQIAREALERVIEYPRDIAESLAPHAQRFGYPRGDGVALLDEFLRRAPSDSPMRRNVRPGLLREPWYHGIVVTTYFGSLS